MDGKTAERFVKLIPPLCGECMDSDSRKYEEAAREQTARQRQAKSEYRIKMANIPNAYKSEKIKGMRFDRHAVTTLSRWGQDVKGILLTGGVGTGKTTLAGVASWKAVEQGRPLRWVVVPLLLARLNAGWGTSDKEWATDVLSGDYSLVLDDIDKARPSEYAAEVIFSLVDSRISREIPLLVTSNLSLGEIATRWVEPFGDAIASRLATCELVELQGEDRRLQR